MQKVESFKLYYTKVKAPYIRKYCKLNGDKVIKFDLRFLQPNEEAFETAAIDECIKITKEKIKHRYTLGVFYIKREYR